MLMKYSKCLCLYNTCSSDVSIYNLEKMCIKLQTKIQVWMNSEVSSLSRCSKVRCNWIGVLSSNWTGGKNKLQSLSSSVLLGKVIF